MLSVYNARPCPRAWCKGCTRAFQALSPGSNPGARLPSALALVRSAPVGQPVEHDLERRAAVELVELLVELPHVVRGARHLAGGRAQVLGAIHQQLERPGRATLRPDRHPEHARAATEQVASLRVAQCAGCEAAEEACRG